MRFKYYLRGAGLGILLATLVLSVAFALHGRSVSDEEVIRRAEALGMYMPENDDEKNGNIETEETEDTENTGVEDTQTVNAGTEDSQNISDMEETKYFLLVIERGDTARIIGQKLQDGGVVTDAEAFRKYLGNSGKDQSIATGTYMIPYGSSFSKMIEILENGPIDPETLP